MADKLGLGKETRELKIGQSFTNPKSTAFHSIKYDFKPASVDTNKKAIVDVGNNHQVTVTVPHLDGAGVPQTVFKGSQRPYQKECVLVIDRITGEITLEKLACNIQVKKTRNESGKLAPPQDRLGQGSDRSGTTSSSNNNSLSSRSQTPPVGQRISHKTKVTSGRTRPDRQITHLVPKHSPLHASPSYPSPGNTKSPKRDHLHSVNNDTHSQSTLASLPMIGIDDFSEPTLPPSSSSFHHNSSHNHQNSIPTTVHLHNSSSAMDKSPSLPMFSNHNHQPSDHENNGIGEISDSSSSASDSESDTSDIDTSALDKTLSSMNGHNSNSNGVIGSNNSSSTAVTKVAAHLLNEDLCLSESGSESDSD